MSERKRDELDKSQKRIVSSQIAPALKICDLIEWQRACSAFAPPHYAKVTRKMWFADNQKRLPAAREIVEFIDGWTQTFREMIEFENVTKDAIRGGVIEAIRNEQEKQTSTKGRVNVVKLSGFRTLIKWAENPDRLNEGPYGGKDHLPEGKSIVRKTSRRGRKSLKGTFRPPDIDMSAKAVVRKNGRINLKMVIINNYIHPYQNVEVKLSTGEGLDIVGVSPYGWTPEDRTVVVGFLPASLSVEPLHSEIYIELASTDSSDDYMVTAIIHYDNTEKGIREKTKKKVKRIRVR